MNVVAALSILNSYLEMPKQYVSRLVIKSALCDRDLAYAQHFLTCSRDLPQSTLPKYEVRLRVHAKHFLAEPLAKIAIRLTLDMMYCRPDSQALTIRFGVLAQRPPFVSSIAFRFRENTLHH